MSLWVRIFSGNINFLLLISAYFRFVSDSSPAKPSRIETGSVKTKVVAAVSKLPLGCELNPTFRLDENNLPPEYTPRVLLDDDFDQHVESSDSPKEKDTNSDNSTVKQPTNTNILLPDNAFIDRLSPSTSSHKLQDKVTNVLPSELSSNFVSNSSISKRLLFTRFLTSSTPCKKGC